MGTDYTINGLGINAAAAAEKEAKGEGEIAVSVSFGSVNSSLSIGSSADSSIKWWTRSPFLEETEPFHPIATPR